MVEKLIAVALVVSAAAAGVGAGGAAATTTEGPQRADGQVADADPPVVGNYTVERVNDTTFRFEYRFEVAEGVENLTFRIGPARNLPLELHGFERGSTVERLQKVTWTGENRTPAVVAEVDVREWSSYSGVGRVTRDWALVMSPYSTVTWRTEGSDDARTLPVYDVAFTDGWDYGATNGTYVPSLYAYFGPHDTWNATSDDGDRIRMIVPETVSYVDERRDSFEATVELASEIDARQRGPVVGIVIPDTTWRDDVVADRVYIGGLASLGGRGFAVYSRSSLEVWFHEYVHLVQRYRTTEETRWIDEGMAEYLGAYLDYEYGPRSAEGVENWVLRTGDSGDAVLSKPSTWGNDPVNYQKGALVFAYLDGRIRTLTGNRTIFDALERLNAHDGPVDSEDFKDAVAAVVGNRTLDDDIERFTTTSDAPEREEFSFPPSVERNLEPDGTPTATPTTTQTPTATRTATPTETATTDPTTTVVETTTPSTSDGGQGMPGFGAVVAVLALLCGAAVSRYARR